MKLVYCGLFVFWSLSITYAVSVMHSWHQVDLFEAESISRLKESLPIVPTYGAIHFLTPLCSCSQAVFKRLKQRGPLNKIKETVFIIDDTERKFTEILKKSGFKTINLSSKKMTKEFRQAVKGVPLLIIYDDKKHVKYAGGYSEKSITPFTKIDIMAIFTKIKKGRKVASMPILGCAINDEYKKILDPLGLKYAL